MNEQTCSVRAAARPCRFMQAREPPASQDRRCSLRVHTRRGYGSDSSRASALATPVPCGAAPASHPPAAGDRGPRACWHAAGRGARVDASGAVSLCPVRGFWYSEVVLKPTRVTFGACPLRGFPGPVKARGSGVRAPTATRRAVARCYRTAHIRLLTGRIFDDRTGTRRPLHGCGSRHTPRRGPTAQARRTTARLAAPS